MAFEDFEGGAGGDEVTSANTIFNPVFGGPLFTAGQGLNATTGCRGGAGFFFNPGHSSMVYYIDNCPSAAVWGICNNNFGAPFPGENTSIINEIFGPTSGTNDGGFFLGFNYDADNDHVNAQWFDPDFVLTTELFLPSASISGWQRYVIKVPEPLKRTFEIYSLFGSPDVPNYSITVDIYDYTTSSSFPLSTGYSLGVSAAASGATYDVFIDEFMAPLEEPPPVAAGGWSVACV